MYNLFIIIIALLAFSGCGGSNPSSDGGSPQSNNPTPVNTPLPDNSIVRGRAQVDVGMSNETALFKLFKSLIPYAYAATGSTTVTYTNAASVNFTISVTNFVASGFTGNTLNLGHVDLATLSDNNLAVCNPGGNTKCTQAIIRVYTTGSVSGFVNTTDGTYGAPVYAGTLNPSTAVGLNSANSVQTQLVTIASSKHKLTISDFPTPQYNVTSDFSNAGAGNYSMTFVVEYALAP